MPWKYYFERVDINPYRYEFYGRLVNKFQISTKRLSFGNNYLKPYVANVDSAMLVVQCW